jgi:GntR family transcriptional regulator/MocR family aminotransferase
MSRNTVLHAYAQLQAEGYVHSRVGSGTFVAETTPESQLSAEPGRPRAGGGRAWRGAAGQARAGAGGRCLGGAAAMGRLHAGRARRHAVSRTAPSAASSRGCGARRHPELLTYSHGGGHPALRAAIAEHLRVARAVRCDADQVLVTEGVHQAIDLSLRMLVDPRDTVWVEEPGYWGFHKVLQMSAARVLPLRVGKPAPTARPKARAAAGRAAARRRG